MSQKEHFFFILELELKQLCHKKNTFFFLELELKQLCHKKNTFLLQLFLSYFVHSKAELCILRKNKFKKEKEKKFPTYLP